MKQILLSVAFVLTTCGVLFAQNRIIARGATPGELYLTGLWYGIYHPVEPPYYDTLQTALYRITENGKKITIQYDEDYFADEYSPPYSLMLPDVILADATPGVVYNKNYCYKDDGYTYTLLWVSFDYGKNWIFREEIIGHDVGYFSANVEGLIYRAASADTNKMVYYELRVAKFELIRLRFLIFTAEKSLNLLLRSYGLTILRSYNPAFILFVCCLRAGVV